MSVSVWHTECEYAAVYLDEMIDTVDFALCSETEAAQSRWMTARSVEEKVRAMVGMETRGVSPDALSEVASALKLLVRSSETALRTVNTEGKSWPVYSLAVWALANEEPQIGFQSDVALSDTQQAAAA